MQKSPYAAARRLAAATAATICGLAAAQPPAPDALPVDHAMHHSGPEHDTHAHHRGLLERPGYIRSEHHYPVPDLVLTNQDGRPVALRDALQGERPTLVNFIFTTCTTICPVLSASFSQTRRTLGDEAGRLRWISVSIDPDHDTPERLRRYAARFHADDGWEFLTGNRDDVVTLLKAFDAFRGDKSNHIPLTLLHGGADRPWIRLEGFAGAEDLVREYRDQTAGTL